MQIHVHKCHEIRIISTPKFCSWLRSTLVCVHILPTENRGEHDSYGEEQQQIFASGEVFAAMSSLPWYPFVQYHGVSIASLQALTEYVLHVRT